MQTALTNSYNTAFAKLGVDVGQSAIRTAAAGFGIGTGDSLQTPLRVSPSTLGDIPDTPALAQSSIGQRDVALTPLQAAMIASAVSNNGVLMTPYLVDRVEAPDLTVLDTTQPEQLSTAVSPQVAGQLTQMMRSVVQNGTGRRAQIPDVEVAGKTGTAENAPGQQPHAWFIGFAHAHGKQVAVAVIIEHGGDSGSEATGGEAAAPIAKDVMAAVLRAGGG
jgi:peptidoglycan glycosyltransferase